LFYYFKPIEMKSTLTALTVALLFASCAPQQKTTSARLVNTSSSFAMDSIAYVETEFEARQYNDLALLVGSWSLDKMQRQQRLPEETLDNAKFSLGDDGKFRISTTCGYVTGDYILKGRSIKFSNASSEWYDCADKEQASALVKLLNNTVSAYTVSGEKLYLRDGSSNIVFSASRQAEEKKLKSWR
jgi:heat shock protein HslJ